MNTYSQNQPYEPLLGTNKIQKNSRVSKVGFAALMVLLILGAFFSGVIVGRLSVTKSPKISVSDKTKTSFVAEARRPFQVPNAQRTAVLRRQTSHRSPGEVIFASRKYVVNQRLKKVRAMAVKRLARHNSLLKFVGVPLSFKNIRGNRSPRHAVDVTSGATFWIFAFEQDPNKPMKNKDGKNLSKKPLVFKRVKGHKNNEIWYSDDFYGHQRIKKLAKQELGLVACVAGDQFDHCANKQSYCSVVVPSKDYKPELIKAGNIAVISYWLDKNCSLKAYLTPHINGDDK